MTTLLLALAAITFLYFFFALSRIFWVIFRAHVCAICAAVSLTWAGFLYAYLSGRSVDPLVLALLMGGSVVGLMYAMQKTFEKHGWTHFWFFRWLIITFGMAFCWALLNERWVMTGVAALLGVLLGLFVFSFSRKPSVAVASSSAAQDQKSIEWSRAKREFEERMKQCCE
ncbi:MAG: hypothetical protein AAB444_02115 [Patescibacteria group bacterium]